MALSYRAFSRSCFYVHLSRPVRCNLNRHFPLRVLASGFGYNAPQSRVNLEAIKQTKPLNITVRQCTSKPESPEKDQTPQKLGLVQRFKEMYKNYWYVLLPVHMATSAMWFGGFYYMIRSGVDILSLAESLGVSEKVIEPLRDSSAGYLALAFACYKIVTPLRYAVTLGGTTFAINRLRAIGWIKPVPSRERLKEMFNEKKENLQDRFQESKTHYKSQMQEKKTQYTNQMYDKKNQMMDEMRNYKTQMREIKDKIKKM